MPETMCEINKFLENISLREQQENAATASITSDTLARLRVKIDELPTSSQRLLAAAARALPAAGRADPAALALRHSTAVVGDLDRDYRLLVMTQKERQLAVRIERNRREIQGLRAELAASRAGLRLGDVSADGLRALRLKLVSYEESLERVMAKKLSVPDGVQPRALQQLIAQLAAARVEERRWREQADEILISREIREKLHSLRK